MARIALHPLVASLGMALAKSADGLPALTSDEVTGFRARASVLTADERTVVVEHLIALALHCRQGGLADDDVLVTLCRLVGELIGNARAAADAFQNAGIGDAARMLASTKPLRAPPVPQSLPPSVQARRGLRSR